MTTEDFDTVTALAIVRQIKSAVEQLDTFVGPHVRDEEHAQMRRTAREWEQRISGSLKIRKQRTLSEGAAS